MRRTTAVVLGSFLLATAPAVVAPAPAVAADAVVGLGITAFRDVLVDDAHGHVFVTGGGSNGIVVRDLAGGAVTTITNQPGASRMALADDGSRLYVALSQGDAVSAIDTTTLTEVARYATGASTCPASVAVTSGKVWFGYGCSGGTGNLGVVDVSAEPPTVALAQLATSSFYGAPLLQSAPAKQGTLVAAETGLSPSTVRLLDVSGSTPSVVASTQPGSNLQDLAISADGARVITASGSPYHHPAYSTTDLSADGVYGGSNPYPNAVALAGNGLVAAGVNGIYDPDVHVYRADGTLIRRYEVGGYANEGGGLNGGGLALSADGSRLYAVTGGDGPWGGAVRLHVLQDPGKAASAISLTAPASARINVAHAVSGVLTSGVAIPAGRTLTVQRDSAYGVVTLPSVTTGADGSFVVNDKVTKRGVYGYRVTWAGDAEHAGATHRVLVKVLGLVPSLSITTGAGPYTYGAKPLVVAHLGTTKSRTISIYAQPYGGTKTRLRTATVDSNGNLGAYWTMTRRTTFTAYFAGDDTYEPRSVAKVLYSRARLTAGLAGSYGTSGGYRLFRTSVDPVLYVTVAPHNGGACMSYVAQVYSSGAWRTAATADCIRLDSSSQGAAYFSTNAPAGTRFRMRTVFRGTTLNAATTGTWFYGKFTT